MKSIKELSLLSRLKILFQYPVLDIVYSESGRPQYFVYSKVYNGEKYEIERSPFPFQRIKK